MIWTAVLVTAAGCYALKVSGWFLPTALLERERVRTAAALVAGAFCLWLRLPFLVMVLVAAATAAILRAL